MDRAIRAHSQCRAQYLLAACRADRDCDDLNLSARFTDAQRLFQAILIHRINHQLATFQIYCTILDADTFFRIQDLTH